jgi:hypothetical protein
MFSHDIKQTPENVRKVLDIAGWTYEEAAKETGITPDHIRDAMFGSGILWDSEWERLLDKAGRRAFDWDEDAD